MNARRASIREHFLAPARPVWIERPDGLGRAENAVCGDRLELALAIDGKSEGEGERVRAISYRAQGCSALVATASLLCERLEGCALDEAATLDVAALVKSSGGLPPTKAHAPRVAERALREALADHHSRCHP